MIPLRDPVHRAYQYTIAVKGSAINGTTPYELHFDTGSWTTSIPGGALDFSQVTVITQDVTTDWGRPADLVEGQLSVETVDGTVYTLDNYRFYALKESHGGAYLPDDRTQPYGNGAIMGAFPSPYPYRNEQSFPYLLTEKYAANNQGMGIVSTCVPTDKGLSAGWHLMDSYLQIGNTPEITDYLLWRHDAPKWIPNPGFYPEAVPGFQVAIDFPNTNERIVTSDSLVATVDTGAPDLTLRLDAADPQYAQPFATHFVKDGPWVNWNDDYRADAMTLLNASVTIIFTDDKGTAQSYNYDVGSDPYHAYQTPASLFAGRWAGNVPWKPATPSFPKYRINLGNSVYFFWPVYYWDIANARVGIGTRDTSPVSTEAEVAPTSVALAQNFPNPFSRSTTIAFDLATPADVHLAVYDMLGREVAVVATGTYPPGHHEVPWHATAHPAGVYLYRLTIGAKVLTRRMMLAQ